MDFQQAVSAYRSFDPAGWVRVYQLVPMWGGIIAVALGVILVLFGGGKWFRLLAGPMGATVGALWAPVVANKLGFFLGNDAKISLAAAGLLGILGFSFPPGALFFALGLPAGLLGGEMAGPTDWLLGFLPAFLLAGALATAVSRHIGAVASSIAGSWLLVIGTLAALHQVGSIVAAVASQPWGVVIAATLFAVAGSVYQLAVRPSPDQAEKLTAEKARLKRRRDDQKALERRWGAYPQDKE